MFPHTYHSEDVSSTERGCPTPILQSKGSYLSSEEDRGTTNRYFDTYICGTNNTAQHIIFCQDILAILGCIWCSESKIGIGFAELVLVFEAITFL